MKIKIPKKAIIILILFFVIFLAGLLCLEIFKDSYTFIADNNGVLADTGDENRLKKIKEKIKKAGLKPREAKYYRVIDY